MHCIYLETRYQPVNHTGTPARSTPDRDQCMHRTRSSLLEPAELLFYHAKLPPANPDITSAMLLSEYLQRTCVSLTGSDRTEPKSKILMEAIPSLAISHTSVSHAIFAVSTLSMAIHNTHQGASPVCLDLNMQTTINKACDHYGRSLQAMNASLSSLTDSDNSEAIIACAILLTPYELAQLRINRKSRHQQNTAIKAQGEDKKVVDLTWTTYIRGLASLMSSIRAEKSWNDSMMQLYFAWVDGSVRPGYQLTTKLYDTVAISHQLLHKIIEEGQFAVSNLRSIIQKSSGSTSHSIESRVSRATCLVALDYLEEVIKRFVTSVHDHVPQDLFRILLLWIGKIDQSFFELLRKEHTLALAIYAHFLILLILFENVWYIGDLGSASLRDILTTIEDRCKYNSHTEDIELPCGEMFRWPAKILRRYDADC